MRIRNDFQPTELIQSRCVITALYLQFELALAQHHFKIIRQIRYFICEFSQNFMLNSNVKLANAQI